MEKDDIIKLVEEKNPSKLKKLAEELSVKGMARKNYELIKLAIASYTLSKLIQKNYFNSKTWKQLLQEIQKEFNKENGDYETVIREYAALNSRYSVNLWEHSKLKVTAQLYAHGASLERASAITQTDYWDAGNYISTTKIHDRMEYENLENKINTLLNYFEKPRKITCDSSSLIALAQAGLIDIIPFLNKQHEFSIADEILKETVENSYKNIKHTISGLRIKQLIDEKQIKVIQINDDEGRKIIKEANKIFALSSNNLEILQQGEAESMVCLQKNYADSMLVDERTARSLCENINTLEKVLKEEYGAKLITCEPCKNYFKQFNKYTILRSTELTMLAASKGYFDKYKENKHKAIISSIYLLRNYGCSISDSELKQYETLTQKLIK